MASEWPTVRVEEIAKKIAMGPFGSNIKVATFVDDGVPVISGIHLRGTRVEDCEFNFVTNEHAERLKNSNVYRGDVIFTHAGNIGQVAYVPDDSRYDRYVISQRQFYLRCDRAKADPAFVTYFFHSPAGRHRLLANASQVGVPSISRPSSNLKEIEISLPSLKEQRAIVGVLGAIEDRIDNLRKTNATLEAISQALFKSWFVDFVPVRAKAEGREPEGMDAATAALFPGEFENSELGLIPKGWRVEGLGRSCDNVRKQAKPEALDASTPYIGLEHMPRKSIALSDWDSAQGLASGKFWYQRGDVLFGKLRPYFHKVGVASHSGVCSTDILVIRAKSPVWFGFAAMHLSSDALVSYATQLSNGAKMPRTNWHDLAAYKVAMPDDACALAFSEVAAPLVERIHSGIDSMRSLAELRDTLLPRLISGKLRLPEVQAAVAEVA